jgi:hypothetical protein
MALRIVLSVLVGALNMSAIMGQLSGVTTYSDLPAGKFWLKATTFVQAAGSNGGSDAAVQVCGGADLGTTYYALYTCIPTICGGPSPPVFGPTAVPTSAPVTSVPSRAPSASPSSAPANSGSPQNGRPSSQPTTQPSMQPTMQPSMQPSTQVRFICCFLTISSSPFD